LWLSLESRPPVPRQAVIRPEEGGISEQSAGFGVALAVAQPQIAARIVEVLWAESAAGQTQAVGLRGGTPRETRSSGREAFVPVVKPADFRQCHDLAHAGPVYRSIDNRQWKTAALPTRFQGRSTRRDPTLTGIASR
jgi:hypothetical protein